MYFYKYKPNKKSLGRKTGFKNSRGISVGLKRYAKLAIIVLAIVPLLYLADKTIAYAHSRLSYTGHNSITGAISAAIFTANLPGEYLRIKTVTVSGNKFVTEEELSPYLNELKGNNIFKADLKRLVLRLKEHPWIKDVTVKRELPSSIQVAILERMPYLYISSNSRLFIADEEGILMGEKPASLLSLPVVYGVSLSGIKEGEKVPAEGMQSALEVKRELTAAPWVDISSSGIEVGERAQITLHLKEYSIRLGKGRYKEKLKRFYELAKNLKDKGTFKEVDLRFENQVIVKEAGT
ncbi:MAG: FtsQ-type POTRA domain-containing protein [Nitrospira sp.]|nr:FtsQ-type POTRA domain-containing protein [Nitrospira sp.]